MIDTLFRDEPSRQFARDFVSRFEDQPMMTDRIEPMLREAAAANSCVAAGEINAEQGRELLGSFATEMLGTPGHVMEDLTNWYDQAAADAATAEEPPPAEPAQAPQMPPQPAPAAAPASPALADRDALRQQIAKHEAGMRAPENSAEWKAYWREGGADAYRTAIEQLAASTNAPAEAPPQPGPAAAPAQPSPGAPPA